MKRIVTTILACAVAAIFSFRALAADNNTKNAVMNSKAENIAGKYLIEDEEGTSYAKVYLGPDGAYRCQTYGGKPVYDKDGKMVLDQYNQDESLRSLGVHEAVIIFGLKYDPAKKIWAGGKIHHPFKRMMKADCEAYFVGDGKTLCIFGNVAGMGAKRFWKKIE